MSNFELEPQENNNQHFDERFPRHQQRIKEPKQQKRALRFPLNMSMRLLTIAPQFYVTRPHGADVAYLKQKAFKLKEDIEVFEDETQSVLLYNIKADRMLDISAKYHFSSVKHGMLGYTRRHGMQSIWRTHFEIADNEGLRYTMVQENIMIEFIETLLKMIPYLGSVLWLLSGYFLNPTYVVKTFDEQEVARLKRLPALFEGKFELRSTIKLPPEQQELIILSMMTLLLIQSGED